MPKYDDITPRYPGDYRVKEIVLYSYGGSQLDITGLTALINIYQDLDTPFISGNIMFYDTIGAANKLPIIGNEFLEFKMRTPIDGGNGDEDTKVGLAALQALADHYKDTSYKIEVAADLKR